MRTIAVWVALLLVFVLPWENMITIPGLGTASRIVGLLLVGVWLASTITTGNFRRPRPFHLAVYAFFLWNGLSYYWSVSPEETLDRLRTYVQLMVLVAILWDLLRTPQNLVAAMQAYVLGGFVSIANLVLNYRTATAEITGRYAASNFNANDIGLILALGLPMAWYLANFVRWAPRWRFLQLVNYAYLPATLLAILLTGSRGTLVASLPALGFIVLSLIRLSPRSRMVALAVLLVGVTLIPFVIPPDTLERIATTGDSIAQGDFGGRREIWAIGYKLFAQSPLIGIGSGTFSETAGRSAHNVYLSVITDVGLIGLGLLLLLIVFALGDAIQQPLWWALMWLSTLMVLGLGSMVHTWEQRKQSWLMLTLVVIGAELWARRKQRPVAEARNLESPTNNHQQLTTNH